MARSPRQERKVPPQRLILDSGAVIAWSRGEVRTRALLMRALEMGADIRIPVAVLAETLRGGARDAPVHRVRNAVDVFPTDERVGRLAGTLLGGAAGMGTVDAMVASEAVLVEADVLTADPDDLGVLLAGYPRIRVIPV